MSKDITKVLVSERNLSGAIAMLLDEYNKYDYVVVTKVTVVNDVSLDTVYKVEGHIEETE